MKYQVSQIESSSHQTTKVSTFTQFQLVSSIVTRNDHTLLSLIQLDDSEDTLISSQDRSLCLDQSLRPLKNKTNRICLQIAWKKLHFFRQNHNLLNSKYSTFIRKSLNPKGLIVHIHYDQSKRVLWGFLLVESSETQDIKYVKLDFNK